MKSTPKKYKLNKNEFVYDYKKQIEDLNHENKGLRMELDHLRLRLSKLEQKKSTILNSKQEIEKIVKKRKMKKNEMHEYFISELEKRDQTIEHLEKVKNFEKEQHENEKQEKKKEYENQIKQKDDQIEEFRQERKNLETKLEDFQSTKKRLEKLKNDNEKLSQDYQDLNDRYTQKCAETDLRVEKAQDQMREEFRKKLDQTKQKMVKMTGDHLNSKTKQTIERNKQLMEELSDNIKQNSDLLDNNDKMKQHNKNLKQANEILKQDKEELQKKINAKHTLIQGMALKFQRKENQFKEQLKEMQSQLEELSEQNDEIKELNATKDQQIFQLERDLSDTESELDQVQHELYYEKGTLEQLLNEEGSLIEFMAKCLEDLRKKKFEERKRQSKHGWDEQTIPVEIHELEPKDREKLLNYLLAQAKTYKAAHEEKRIDLRKRNVLQRPTSLPRK
eukprot:gb/GECH01006998.1/.p1 GENE.gb/GECH01006998.1/~~gb/GECH01006998.1/.p1  ORF type:complete len:448 (+),score=166.12 gb/GECH01006998.1/:1-1344(+)